MISTIFLLNKKGNLSKLIILNKRVERTAVLCPEAATRSDILYLFCLGNINFIREKSGNFEEWCLLQLWCSRITNVLL